MSCSIKKTEPAIAATLRPDDAGGGWNF